MKHPVFGFLYCRHDVERGLTVLRSSLSNHVSVVPAHRLLQVANVNWDYNKKIARRNQDFIFLLDFKVLRVNFTAPYIFYILSLIIGQDNLSSFHDRPCLSGNHWSIIWLCIRVWSACVSHVPSPLEHLSRRTGMIFLIIWN